MPFFAPDKDQPLNGGSGWTAPRADREEQFNNPQPEMSAWDARFFAGGLGFKDSVRGVTQWAGYREDEMAAEEAQLKELMANPEYGGSVKAAYYAGLVADPVGWFLPVSRIKHFNTVRKFFTQGVPLGAASGGVAGATGYVDETQPSLFPEEYKTGWGGYMIDPPPEQESRSRMDNAILGTGAGAVLGPAAAGIGKGIKKVYEPVGEAAWNVLKHPSGASGTIGGLVGYNAERDATFEEKIQNAIMGASLGAGAGSATKFTDSVGITDNWTEAFGDAIVPYYKMADGYIHAMNRFRGRKGIYAKDWETLVSGVREMPLADRKVLYRMLQEKQFGLDTDDFDYEKLGVSSEARAKIQEYGQALVNLGVLDNRTFTKNIDDYLATSYHKHEAAKMEEPLDMLYNAHHMFKMRGRVENISKAQWDAGQRPDDVGEWEWIEDLAGGMAKVRRQWTKEEKLSMGEIEDAAYALQKTGRQMSHERALGELFRELADTGDVIVRNADPTKHYKIPKNGMWGDLGGQYVTPRTWNNLKKLREFQKDSTMSKWASRYKVANGIWKGLHTIVAPPVMFANVVSSGHMFDMADGNWADVGRAARNMYNKDDDWAQMVEDGVFGSGYMRELDEGQREILKIYSQNGGYLRIGDGPDGLSSAMDFTTKMARKMKEVVWDNPGKFYQLGDNIWRAALYRTKLDELRKAGVDEMTARGMAAKQAKEFFVDYDQNPPLLNGLRQTFLPFFSYTYGTMPRLAEIAAKNPAKYAKWGIIYAGLNQIGENTSGYSEREMEEIGNLVEPNPMMGVPGMPNARVMQPEAVSNAVAPGLPPQSLNAERLFPGGKLTMSEGGTGQIPFLPDMLQPGGGVAGAIGWPMLGINQFQGTNIPEGGKLDATIKNLLPNWEGLEFGDFKSYAEQKVDRADSGKTTKYKDDYSPLTARLSNAGIRIEPMDAGKMAGRIKLSYQKRIKDVKKRISALKRETGIDDATKERLINEQYAKVRKLQEAMQRRLKGE